MHDPFYDLVPRPEPPALVRGEVALLSIDLQYLCAHPDGWMGRLARADGRQGLLDARFAGIAAILPNVQALQAAFRAAGQEVLHARVAYRTYDGREAGRAYMPAPEVQPVARERRDDDLLPEVAALGDELIFSKTSSSVFNSTDIDRVLSRLGIRHLVVAGVVTDGCVELSARDAADRGYAVTLVADGTAASTTAAHEDALARMTDGGFVVARTASEIVCDLEAAAMPGAVR